MNQVLVSGWWDFAHTNPSLFERAPSLQVPASKQSILTFLVHSNLFIAHHYIFHLYSHSRPIFRFCSHKRWKIYICFRPCPTKIRSPKHSGSFKHCRFSVWTQDTKIVPLNTKNAAEPVIFVSKFPSRGTNDSSLVLTKSAEIHIRFCNYHLSSAQLD